MIQSLIFATLAFSLTYSASPVQGGTDVRIVGQQMKTPIATSNTPWGTQDIRWKDQLKVVQTSNTPWGTQAITGTVFTIPSGEQFVSGTVYIQPGSSVFATVYIPATVQTSNTPWGTQAITGTVFLQPGSSVFATVFQQPGSTVFVAGIVSVIDNPETLSASTYVSSVGNSAVSLVPNTYALAEHLAFYNESTSNTVYIGGSTVTTDNGWPLPPLASFTFDHTSGTAGTWWCIAITGTNRVKVLRW